MVHHAASFVKESGNKYKLEDVVKDPYKFTNEKGRAVLDFVKKLTLTPAKMEKSDVEKLRELGFDDRGIYETILVTSYFNYINRIADAIGVELEDNVDFDPSHANS